MHRTHSCKSCGEGDTGGWRYDDVRSLVQRLAHAPICSQLQSLHRFLSQLCLLQVAYAKTYRDACKVTINTNKGLLD